MIRLRQLLLPLLAAVLLPLLAHGAAAKPVAHDRSFTLDWPLPKATGLRVSILPDPRPHPLARSRLFMVEITVLPSGRVITRTVLALPPRPVRDRPPGPDPLILPLPGAMPLFLGALGGLLLVGRRSRRGLALAGRDRPT